MRFPKVSIRCGHRDTCVIGRAPMAVMYCRAGRVIVSFLTAAPELIADAATNLANLGSTIGSANTAAAGATTGVPPAAAR
jgi:hypothetical protein